MTVSVPRGGDVFRTLKDLPLVLRSRMSAVLGLCFRTGGFSDDDADAIRGQVATYKSLRGTLRTGAGRLLTAQAAVAGGPAWDVFQTTPEGYRAVTIWAIQSDTGVADVVVRPVALRSRLTYEVRSIDTGLLGIVSGAALMADGVAVTATPYSAA